MERYRRNPKASTVLYIRVPIEIRKRLVAYARLRDVSLQQAATETLERGLAGASEKRVAG